MNLKNVLLLVIVLVSCSQADLKKIANEGRLFKLTDFYDCRGMERAPWANSPNIEVTVRLLDFTNKTKLFHLAFLENSILSSPYDYKISPLPSLYYEENNINYDLSDIQESVNFIKFEAVSANGKKIPYTFNKKTNQLLYEIDLPEEWKSLGQTEFIKKHTGRKWSMDCIKK